MPHGVETAPLPEDLNLALPFDPKGYTLVPTPATAGPRVGVQTAAPCTCSRCAPAVAPRADPASRSPSSSATSACSTRIPRSSSTCSRPASSDSEGARSWVAEQQVKRWLEGRLVECPLNELAVCVGKPADYFEKLGDAARKQVDVASAPRDEWKARFMAEVEGISSVEKTGWFTELAAAAESSLPCSPSPAGSDVAPRFRYRSLLSKALPGSRANGHRRMLDAGIFDATIPADELRIGHTLAAIKYSSRAEIGSDRVVGKQLSHVLSVAIDQLAKQSGRYYTLSLLIADETATLCLLDREQVRLVKIDDCWSTNLHQLCAIASFLSHLDLATAGFSPLFVYHLDPVRGITPAIFSRDYATFLNAPSLLSDHSLEVIHRPSSHHSPFSRATTVFAVHTEGLKTSSSVSQPNLIIKLQMVADDRSGREAEIFQVLEQASLRDDIRAKLSDLKSSFVFAPLPFQSPILLASCPEQRARLVPRHLEILITSSRHSSRPRRIDDFNCPPPTFQTVISIVVQLIPVLLGIATSAGVLHRDISPGNVLHSNGDLALIDWDCAGFVDQRNTGDGSRIGTLETMSRSLLDACIEGEPFTHSVTHDLESAVFLLWYGLWAGLSESASDRERAWWDRSWAFCQERVPATTIRNARIAAFDEIARCSAERCLRPISPALATLMDDLMAVKPNLPRNPISAEDYARHVLAILEAGKKALDQEAELGGEAGSELRGRWWAPRRRGS